MNKYLIKCEVSDIQQFIFNVSAKEAAREIKNRVAYVLNISEECQNALTKSFEKVEPVYSGVGNFLIKVQTTKNEDDIKSLINDFQKNHLDKDIFPFLSSIKITDDDLTNAINRKMQRAKLQRPLVYDLINVQPLQIADDFNKLKGINAQVPRDKNGNLLNFDDIAKLSDGDAKIAALKIEIDDLSCKNKNGILDNELLKLITAKGLQQNIHIVFSNSDNCFLIGSWNKVFDLAIELKSSLGAGINFSAGIVVAPPKYPMMRLVEDVEEALTAATNKNSITCFGKTVKWNEFKKSQNIAGQLVDLVRTKGESKSLVERIKASDIGISKLQRDASKGRINIPKVWRLKYYLRNIRKQNKDEVEKLFNEYTQAVLDAFMNRQATNPDLYPLAARWAELLLKK